MTSWELFKGCSRPVSRDKPEAFTAMSSQTSVESGFLDKLTDGLSSLSDGMAQFILRLFGSSNERAVRKLGYVSSRDPKVPPAIVPGSLLAQINALEAKMKP